jgi:hypothetical protein
MLTEKQLASSTPRPAPPPAISWRPPQPRIRPPSSDFSDSGRTNGPPPRAPEPPPVVTSPTLSSSQTLVSSHTSYSVNDQPASHWAQNVLIGLDRRVRSTFRPSHQVFAEFLPPVSDDMLTTSRDIGTCCLGTAQPAAVPSLYEEGFDMIADL